MEVESSNIKRERMLENLVAIKLGHRPYWDILDIEEDELDIFLVFDNSQNHKLWIILHGVRGKPIEIFRDFPQLFNRSVNNRY